jgi:hypothetical protein
MPVLAVVQAAEMADGIEPADISKSLGHSNWKA